MPQRPSEAQLTRTASAACFAVAAPSERAGLHMADAQRLTELLPSGELVRLRPAGHRQVVGGRAQVLPDGDDVDADGGEIVQQTGNFLIGFAETQHEAGLDGEASCLGARQHCQAAGVAGAGAHGAATWQRSRRCG